MHDLSLIRPNGDVPMCYPPLTWNDEPLSLYYGRSIRLLSVETTTQTSKRCEVVVCIELSIELSNRNARVRARTRHKPEPQHPRSLARLKEAAPPPLHPTLSSTQAPISDGSSVPVHWGATIGQSISRLVINNKEVSSDVSEQFARSYLWRTHGVLLSLQGWSGAPLTVTDNQARTSVFGFQNWEWLPSKNVWDEKQADLKKLRNLTPEEVTEMLGRWGEHPFYGLFFLPSEITSSEIMWTRTKRA
jgi:hypothetical protein